MSVDAELQAGDHSRIGPYRLVAVLGVGGMGQVYLGRSPGGREVAVKVIRAELAADPEFRTRFRREVAAARLVNGLYTAAVVDADTEGPVPWLATAYINGPSLADAVQRGGPLPPAALRALAAGLAEGLSAIHAAGVVHRDLKPSNVLLAADGPRVIDFGIAHATEASSLTGTDVVIGSPGYLSPEQAEANRGVGPASDMFALGTVLCYAATGRSPWGTGSAAALIYRVVHGEPDIADVPEEIRPLVARCLAKLPGQRPTAADVLAELGDPGPIGAWFAQPDDTIGLGMPSGVDTTVRPSADHTDAGPRIRRRRRRNLTLLAAATVAAVGVPLIVIQAQSSPGSTGHAPATHTVTSGPPALVGVYAGPEYDFNSPMAIAADDSHVWVLNGEITSTDSSYSTVTELNARTGAWVQTLAATRYGFNQSGGDSEIVDDGTNVWVGDLDSATEINAGDGSLERILRIPDSVNIHGWPTVMVRAGNQLWGATPETCRPLCGPNSADPASLIEFDAGNGSYERSIITKTAQQPIALASDGTHIWFVASTGNVNADDGSTDTAGSVTEYNASDGRQIWSVPATIYSNSQTFTTDSIAYADGRLWVANGQTVTELNASNGKLLRALSGEQYKFTGQPAITVAGAHVFVVNGAGNSVTEIDASTGAHVFTLTAARYHLDNPIGITVVGNHAWILNAPLNGPASVVELALSAG